MALSASALTAGGTGVDATSFTTASITPTANRLILACAHTVQSTPFVTPVVTGNGLTWVNINTRTQGVNDHFTLFRALGASPSAGGVTFNYTGTNIVRITWSIIEIDGVDTSGTNGSGAIVQSAVNSGDNTSNTLTVTLASFADAVNNAAVGAFGVRSASDTLVAGTGFTFINQATIAEFSTTGTEFQLGEDTTVNASWTNNANRLGIAIEVKATAAGTNMQINIGDAWKTVSGMQINIGDTWKTVAGAQINIGDAWKTIF